MQTDTAQWKKPDYEPTASEPLVEDDEAHVSETHLDDEDDDEVSDSSSKSSIDEAATQQPRQQLDQQRQSQQTTELSKCQKVGKRKLSLDSLSSDVARLKKVTMRTLSVGTPRELAQANGHDRSDAAPEKADDGDAVSFFFCILLIRVIKCDNKIEILLILLKKWIFCIYPT